MSKDQKAFDYEDETISDEDKLKQVNEDYKQGGVNLMSEDEKKEQETTTEGKWTLSKDKLWIFLGPRDDINDTLDYLLR